METKRMQCPAKRRVEYRCSPRFSVDCCENWQEIHWLSEEVLLIKKTELALLLPASKEDQKLQETVRSC